MSEASRRTVWAIADLHLSFAREDHRERFAERWRDHATTIAREWQSVVRRNDLVLLPGDISMARNHREVQPDLAWLDRLPGIKILSAGNHDGWWNGAKKIRPMLRKSLRVVDGDAIEVNGVIVCGTRGAAVPDEDDAAGQKALAKETQKLKTALDAALRLRAETKSPIVAMWHYPPFDLHGRPGAAVTMLESAGVAACVYGHLHIEGQWATTVQGEISGVLYRCVAADAVGFRPLRIL
jgi:predicted phosphohydrolase